MSNYLDPRLNRPGPAPWKGSLPEPQPRGHLRPGPVSSGSSRNLNRGYVGGMPQGSFADTTSFLASHGLNYLYYRSAMRRVDSDIDKIHEDIVHLRDPWPAPPRPGTPTGVAPRPDGHPVARAADGGPLALGPGARPMPERTRVPMGLPPGPTAIPMGPVPWSPAGTKEAAEGTSPFGEGTPSSKGGSPVGFLSIGPDKVVGPSATAAGRVKGRRPTGLGPRAKRLSYGD